MKISATAGRTREFRREDIPAVADLWVKIFQHRSTPASPALQAYFAEVFCDNPWANPDCPSYVYEELSGGIVGFIGTLPRRMIFNGKPARIAVSSQFMVDTSRHHGMASLELMRKFLAGPQDLSLTDGATDGARRIWEALRGESVALYSCVWTRVLRPAAHLALQAGEKAGGVWLSRSTRPISWLLDRAATRLAKTPWPEPRNAAVAEPATAEALAKWIPRLTTRWQLRPDYDASSLAWLLRDANKSTRRGTLHAMLVKSARGEPLGWYLYYSKPGRVGKVLQLGGKEGRIGEVVQHLFRHAWDAGCVAVTGRIEPRFVRELAVQRCNFDFAGVNMLVHARDDRALAAAIHRGDAYLTRLDGEWWMRFHEESWL